MASTEEVLKALQNANIATLAATEPEELVIDAESRTITVPSSERLFGVTGDMNIERKYFRCPKIVGDNVDLSTHQIFIAYVYTETESGSIFPSIGVAPYHCEDVEVDGEDITFSWKLTGNVFKNPGFILFKMYAKRTEADPNTVFNTTPAIGTVLATIPDGTEEIKEEYPDVIAQIFDRLDALESGGGGTGGTTNYENLSNKPQINGVTLTGNKTSGDLKLQPALNVSDKTGSDTSYTQEVKRDASTNKLLVPASGGTVDPEQIKQAVNGYLEENPPSGMTSEQEEQLGKVWIEDNPSYTITDNRSQIFDTVENGKANKITITDGSDYWDGEPEVSYPGTLNVKTLRENRFYANMWLPNGMDMDQSYRYAADKNGQIRLYDILNQKSDLTGLSPWGICLKGEGKSFPTGQCHFIISKIRVLGLDSNSGKWKLVKTCKPIAALFDIAQTSAEGTFVDVDRTVLSDDMYMFSIRQSTSWTMAGDMCFHFYPENTDAVTKEDIQDCSRILIAFRIRVQEAENSGIFTCSCGCDALGGTGVEAFFSRFNAVTDTLQELSSNNCLESESNILTDNLEAINELIYKEESVVSDEQVKGAVDSYLEENPVSGMTAEQEQQLNQNTTDVADLKSALTSVTLGMEGDLLYIYINGEKVGLGIEINGNEEPIVPVVPTDIMSKFKYLGPTTYSPGTYTAWCPTGLIYDDTRDVYVHFMFVRGSHYASPDQIQLWFNTINPDTLEHSEPIYVGDGSANAKSGGGFTGTCVKNGVYYAFSVAHGYYTSNDGGKSWSHNEYGTAPSGVWGCYVLDNGRMIMGSDDGASVNYCSISDDNGKNWEKITVTGEFDEPTFVDFGKGSIMAIIRKQIASADPLAKPFFRVSSDYGETWSEAVEMQSVGEMNANNCNAFVHDNYVELFVGCRIPDTNSDYTGTIYRINQYVLDRNKGPVDQFEFVNTVLDYKPDTALEEFGTSTTKTDDFSTPCIAIKSKEQALMMFYGPTRLGVTHQLIAVGNVPVDKYEIPSIIPKSYKTTQSFDGSNGSIVNICESYGIVNSNGYPNLQNGYLKIDDIRDGGFIHLGLICRGFGGNQTTTFTVLTTANVINGKIKSGSYYSGLYRTPLPDDVDQLPRHPARKMAKSYENGEVLHLYAFIKNEEWWIYDDVGTWYRSSLGDCDIKNVDFTNNLDSFVIYPNNKEELTTYKTIGGLSGYQNIAIFEYDKQSA